MYGQGISRVGELVDLAAKADVIQKAGAWFSYKGERLGQGRENVKELLTNNTELASRIENELWENIDKLAPKKKAAKAKTTVTPVEDKSADAKKSSASIDILVED